MMNSNAVRKRYRFPKQKYDYFLVLDFEATCEKQKMIKQVSFKYYYILKFYVLQLILKQVK